MVSRYSGGFIVNGRLKQVGECFWEVRGGRKRRSAVFECVCGIRTVIDHQKVIYGKTESCGCRKNEPDVSNRLTHGATSRLINGSKRTRSYTTWGRMIQRCTNQNDPKFAIYGARGIRVCDKWFLFAGFIEDMGDPPAGLSLDRIDVNGNYELSNCRWATAKQQANNTRVNVRVTLNGRSMTLKEAAEEEKVPYKRLWKYVRKQNVPLIDAIRKCRTNV
jgi:hypothetical protein